MLNKLLKLIAFINFMLLINLTTMKKFTLLILILTTFLGKDLHAQFPASTYGYQALSGTFTEIAGTSITSIQTDDNYSTSLPIGFTFNFCGLNYTNFVANSNGTLSFNAASSSAPGYNDAGSFGDFKPGLFFLWDDISGSAGTATYETSGTAPNRIFTLQLKNWRWNYSSSYTPTISMQVKLYETTNYIEYIYRQETGTGNLGGSSGASIGIVDGAATPTYLSLNNTTATATASSTTFTSNIIIRPATGQIYRFMPPVPCNSSTVYPVSATTTTGAVLPLCAGTNVPLKFVPVSPMPIATQMTYQWQSSATATGPWTNVGTPTAIASTSIQTNVNTYYRCVVLCSGTATTLASSPLLVTTYTATNPVATGATICENNSANLTATGLGTNIWYNSSVISPTSYLGTGNTINTGNLSASTNFYVNNSSSYIVDSIGLGATSSTTDYTFFYAGWGGYKHQYIITEAEMLAMGFIPGSLINSLGVQIVSNSSNQSFASFKLAIGTSAVPLTAMVTGLTDVYSSTAYVPTAGRNMFNFTAPYLWTGGNLIIQTCWSNNNTGASSVAMLYDTYPTTMGMYRYADNQTPATICGYTSLSYTMTVRPKFFLSRTSCLSSMTTVPVTVVPYPVTDLQYAIFCSADLINNPPLATLNVTQTGTGNMYNWYILGDTTSISTNPIYNPTIAGTYIAKVANSTGCTIKDTAVITFGQIEDVHLGNDTTICQGENIILMGPLSTSYNYAWSTGSTDYMIDIFNSGTYSLEITDRNSGCKTNDTINVTVAGVLPSHDGISAIYTGGSTMQFNLINPQGINNYLWSFGDGGTSTQPTPSHTYSSNGTYVITVKYSNTCKIKSDSSNVSINGVGIVDVDQEGSKINVYPNPVFDHKINIKSVDGTIINSVVIYDILGKEVMNYTASIKGSSTTLSLDENLPTGMYQIIINTNNGIFGKKIKLIK